MWNFVSQIQATLDEAAGINTRGDDQQHDDDQQHQQPRGGNDNAHYDPHNISSSIHDNDNGWGDDDDFDLDYDDDDEPTAPAHEEGESRALFAEEEKEEVEDEREKGEASVSTPQPSSSVAAAAAIAVADSSTLAHADKTNGGADNNDDFELGSDIAAEEEEGAKEEQPAADSSAVDAAANYSTVVNTTLGNHPHQGEGGWADGDDSLSDAETPSKGVVPFAASHGEEGGKKDEKDGTEVPRPFSAEAAGNTTDTTDPQPLPGTVRADADALTANVRPTVAKDSLPPPEASAALSAAGEGEEGGDASAPPVTVNAAPTSTADSPNHRRLSTSSSSTTATTNNNSPAQQLKRQHDREQQMMRLQALLAEETNARVTAEEKITKAMAQRQQIETRVRQMKEAHATALANAARKGSAQSSQLEAALQTLQREGAQMSRQLGEERSKTRELAAAHKANEALIESLQQQLAARDATIAAQKQSIQEYAEAAKTRASEIKSITAQSSQRDEALQQQEEENDALKEVIEQLKASAQQEITEAEAKEEALRHEFEQSRNELLAELEGMRLQLRRSTLDNERALVAMERELSAANERANAADLRVMEATRSNSDATRELSGELTVLSDRVSRLQEQVRERSQQVTSLNQQLKDEREAFASSHRSEVEHLKTQLEGYTRDQGGATAKLVALQEETRREREQWRRREQGLTESIQELRAAVRNAVTSNQNSSNSNVPNTTKLHQTLQSSPASLPDTSELIASLVSPQPNHNTSPSAPTANIGVVPPNVAPNQHQQAPAASRVVERELARVSSELAVLRNEHSALHAAHKALAHEHEVLMEMYGEKEEETMVLTDQLSILHQQHNASSVGDTGNDGRDKDEAKLWGVGGEGSGGGVLGRTTDDSLATIDASPIRS